jgi:hypothetical protein
VLSSVEKFRVYAVTLRLAQRARSSSAILDLALGASHRLPT